MLIRKLAKEGLIGMVYDVLFFVQEGWAFIVFVIAAVLLGWYVSSFNCNWVHPVPVSKEDLARCAPASDFGQCLRRLGHDQSKYVCE